MRIQMRVFHKNDGVTHSPLWELTWKRISQFLPNLREELFDKDPSKFLFWLKNISYHNTTMESYSFPVLTSREQPTVAQQSETLQSNRKNSSSIILEPPHNSLVHSNVSLVSGHEQSTQVQFGFHFQLIFLCWFFFNFVAIQHMRHWKRPRNVLTLGLLSQYSRNFQRTSFSRLRWIDWENWRTVLFVMQ